MWCCHHLCRNRHFLHKIFIFNLMKRIRFLSSQGSLIFCSQPRNGCHTISIAQPTYKKLRLNGAARYRFDRRRAIALIFISCHKITLESPCVRPNVILVALFKYNYAAVKSTPRRSM